MSFIRLSKVGFSLPARTLFSDLSLTLGHGRQALVGHNGVGKSTLACLIAGDLEAESGYIERHADVVYCRQFPSTPRLESDGPESGGEKRIRHLREAFSEVARREGEGRDVILILDEPTNDLDRAGRDVVLDYARSRANGLLIISHDRELLNEVDEIFELSSRGLRRYGGGYEFYDEAVHEERARTQRDIERARHDRDRVVRESREKNERQEKRMREGQRHADKGGTPRILLGARKRRAEETRGRIAADESFRQRDAELKVKLAADERRFEPFVRLDFTGDPKIAKLGNSILVRAENLQLQEGPKWIGPLQFQIHAGDRYWLRGRNGAGKSSLLEILRHPPNARRFSGELWRSSLLDQPGRLGFLDQHQSSLKPEQSVLETIAMSTRFSPVEIRSELAFYGFTGEAVHTQVEKLSGGERLRLALAQIFLGPSLPMVLILDEPTNNLDFASQALLTRAIQGFPGSVVLVTHDDAFGSALVDFREWSLGE